MYAAKILNDVFTELIAKRHQQIDGDRSRRSRLSDNPLFCFVILTTPEYKDRMASLAKPGSNAGIDITATGSKLNETDLKELLDTIKDAVTLPRQLKESVKTIRIS